MGQVQRGRPRKHEDRPREMLRLLVVEGLSWHDAAAQARVRPETVLKLLNRADFAAVARSVLEQQLVVAVEVAASPATIAA